MIWAISIIALCFITVVAIAILVYKFFTPFSLIRDVFTKGPYTAISNKADEVMEASTRSKNDSE